VNEWLVGALGVLAVLACPAMMLVAFLGNRLPWRRRLGKAQRPESEPQA
jgi:hypothetical protein